MLPFFCLRVICSPKFESIAGANNVVFPAYEVFFMARFALDIAKPILLTGGRFQLGTNRGTQKGLECSTDFFSN